MVHARKTITLGFEDSSYKIQMLKFKCQTNVKTNPNVKFGILILVFDIFTLGLLNPFILQKLRIISSAFSLDHWSTSRISSIVSNLLLANPFITCSIVSGI